MARLKAAVYTLSEKTNRNAEAKEIRENIRNYDNAFAFSSLGAKNRFFGIRHEWSIYLPDSRRTLSSNLLATPAYPRTAQICITLRL